MFGPTRGGRTMAPNQTGNSVRMLFGAIFSSRPEPIPGAPNTHLIELLNHTLGLTSSTSWLGQTFDLYLSDMALCKHVIGSASLFICGVYGLLLIAEQTI